MAITKEQKDWLEFRRALGDALVGNDLVEIDYEFDIPEDLPADTLKLLNSLNAIIKSLRALKEDLK